MYNDLFSIPLPKHFLKKGVVSMMAVIMKCDRCAKETRALYDIPYLVVNPTSKKIEEGYVRGYELCEKCARELIDIINKYKEKGV